MGGHSDEMNGGDRRLEEVRRLVDLIEETELETRREDITPERMSCRET